MTNTTETFWDVDGESLQTYAFNIVTLGGDRETPPPTRGENITIPYMPGSMWVPKIPDSRVVTLGMWVIGANEDGTQPTDADARRTYDQNWRHLRRLLWTPRRQFTLTKRFWLPEADLVAAGVSVAALPQSGAWRLYTASARGEYAGGLNPTMNGPARSAFTVDILLSDPFFYGSEIEIDFSMAPADGSHPGPQKTISVLGDDRTTAIEVDFEGPLSAPRMTNSSEESLWLSYSTEVLDGESATVRVAPFSATHYPSGVPYKSSGYVRHAGDHFWLFLTPGEADLALSAQGGTGVATIRYQPVWV